MVTFNKQQRTTLCYYLEHLDEYRALRAIERRWVSGYLDGTVTWERLNTACRDFLTQAGQVLAGVR
jgi:hypothetical protein